MAQSEFNNEEVVVRKKVDDVEKIELSDNAPKNLIAVIMRLNRQVQPLLEKMSGAEYNLLCHAFSKGQIVLGGDGSCFHIRLSDGTNYDCNPKLR